MTTSFQPTQILTEIALDLLEYKFYDVINGKHIVNYENVIGVLPNPTAGLQQDDTKPNEPTLEEIIFDLQLQVESENSSDTSVITSNFNDEPEENNLTPSDQEQAPPTSSNASTSSVGMLLFTENQTSEGKLLISDVRSVSKSTDGSIGSVMEKPPTQTNRYDADAPEDSFLEPTTNGKVIQMKAMIEQELEKAKQQLQFIEKQYILQNRQYIKKNRLQPAALMSILYAQEVKSMASEMVACRELFKAIQEDFSALNSEECESLLDAISQSTRDYN